MKRLMMINEFDSNAASNKYEDIASLSITNLNGNLLVETLKDAYAYVLEHKVTDIVFIARNEIYIYLTELWYLICGGGQNLKHMWFLCGI